MASELYRSLGDRLRQRERPDGFFQRGGLVNYSLSLSDALEFLKAQPDNAFDLAFTDPPYGIGETNNRNLSRGTLCSPTDYGEHKWDEEKIPDEYFHELKRVCKRWIVFGGNYYAHVLGSSDGPIVWDKDNGETHFADAEIAWTNIPGACRIYKFKWQGMLQENSKKKERRIYPTQKPVALATRILRDYAERGWTVLDPFMGSGALLEAGLRLGMTVVGCDVSKQAMEIATRRLDDYAQQVSLFEADELWKYKPPLSGRGGKVSETNGGCVPETVVPLKDFRLSPEAGRCAREEQERFPERTAPKKVEEMKSEIAEAMKRNPLPADTALYDELFGKKKKEDRDAE